MENAGDDGPSYTVAIMEPKDTVRDISDKYKQRTFRSARHALVQLERDVNRELYRRAKE